MNPFVSNGNKLKWKFEDLNDLDENGKFSDIFKIGPTDWKIKVRTEMKNDVKYLAAILYYAGENENERNWICQMNMSMKCMNQNENGTDIFKKDTRCYSNSNLSWGWTKFYKWDDLVKNGYVKNDSIIMVVEMSIKNYDFSKHIPTLTDITFKIEDTEFHTNKGILCLQSEHFYDLLINKTHEETVIEIEDVELKDFRYFLASFYLFFNAIDEKNYEKLIELAEKYKVSSLHKHCENYLLKDTEKSVEKKLKYAEKYNYYELMKQSIESLDNARKIKNLQKTDEFDNFKESTKLMIMTRVLDFC